MIKVNNIDRIIRCKQKRQMTNLSQSLLHLLKYKEGKSHYEQI